MAEFVYGGAQHEAFIYNLSVGEYVSVMVSGISIEARKSYQLNWNLS